MEFIDQFFHQYIRLPRILMLSELKNNRIQAIKFLMYDDENNNMSVIDIDKFVLVVNLWDDKGWKLKNIEKIDLQNVIDPN